ncbi:MAG: hypothetical protein KGZ56_03730, partial [Dethiobacter sp.]|nr:hypothetical protein [Dethiobacter sp.]
QITEVRLLIGLEVPSKYDLVASRKKNIRQKAVFILPMVPRLYRGMGVYPENSIYPLLGRVSNPPLHGTSAGIALTSPIKFPSPCGRATGRTRRFAPTAPFPAITLSLRERAS